MCRKNKRGALVISDLHIGDLNGAVSINPKERENYIKVKNGAYYIHKLLYNLDNQLKKETKNIKIEYLILMGDILDVAVSNEADVYNLAKKFFKDFISKYFHKIIYIPGNHDHHLWEMIQSHNNIISRIENNKEAFRIPNINELSLNLNVVRKTDKIEAINDSVSSKKFMHCKNSFIESIFGKPVYLSYPNLYIYGMKNKQKYGICVTHGHMLEHGWNKTDEEIPGYNSVVLDTNEEFKNLEMKNVIFTEMTDYLFAQNYSDNAEALKNNEDLVKNREEILGDFKLFLPDSVYNKYLKQKDEEDRGGSIDNLKPINLQKLYNNKDIVDKYLLFAKQKMEDNFKGIVFNKFLYGHTHIPSFKDKYLFYEFDETKGTTIELYNTGGWVNIQEKSNQLEEDRFEIDKYPNPMFINSDGEIEKIKLFF